MQDLLTFAQGHIGLMLALLAVVLALIANEVHGNLTGGKKLTTSEAVRLINDQDALVLDVRPVADFKKGHLLGAVNIPADKLKDRLAELPKDKARPVIVVCALGGSSRESAMTLKAAGHAESFPLAGGINAWLAASLPVTVK